jgi:hypothetical protein
VANDADQPAAPTNKRFLQVLTMPNSQNAQFCGDSAVGRQEMADSCRLVKGWDGRNLALRRIMPLVGHRFASPTNLNQGDRFAASGAA